MRPNGEHDASPRKMNIGMMPLTFRHLPDRDCKIKPFLKVWKEELTFKMMFVTYLPVGANLSQKPGNLLSF